MEFERNPKQVSAGAEYGSLTEFIEDRISQRGTVRLVLNEVHGTDDKVSNVIVDVVKPDASELEDKGEFEHTMSQIPGFLCVYTDNEHYQYINESNIVRVLIDEEAKGKAKF